MASILSFIFNLISLFFRDSPDKLIKKLGKEFRKVNNKHKPEDHEGIPAYFVITNKYLSRRASRLGEAMFNQLIIYGIQHSQLLDRFTLRINKGIETGMLPKNTKIKLEREWKNHLDSRRSN